MSRIGKKFQELKKQSRKALVTFITAGDPDLAVTAGLVKELERKGADIIELGVPFSDSIADGPTIQRASQRALEKGVTLQNVLDLVRKLRKETQIPLVLMTSYNLIYHFGVKKFVVEAVKVGVDGIIIPDLPPEEASKIKDLDIIFLVAPSSSEERIKLAAKNSSGFVYLISLLGITGVRKEVSQEAKQLVQRIRRYTDKPVCIGFGISRPEHVRQVFQYADGVIVGSAIIDVIEKNMGKPDLVAKVGDFVKSLAA